MGRAFLEHDETGWTEKKLDELSVFRHEDLSRYVSGRFVRPEPRFLRRTDDRALLYQRKRHWLQGEPESGKSWIALHACAQLLAGGETVVYLDWESDAEELVGRLRLLGVGGNDILRRFRYISPPGPMHRNKEVLEFLGDFEFTLHDAMDQVVPAALVVFDACAEAMAVEGLDENVNKDVEMWLQGAPAVAIESGCAILVIDHVVKDREGRGRWARGAGHKLGSTDVSYSVEKIEEFAPGSVGRALITVQKDRPGSVRAFAVDKTQAGLFVLDATDAETLTAEIWPTKSIEERGAAAMDKLRARDDEPWSKSQLGDIVGGGHELARKIVDQLIETGQLVEEGRRGGHPTWVTNPASTPPPPPPADD